MADGGALAQHEDASLRDPRMRAYARAQRHSRAVRFLKFALPGGAILGIGAVLVVTVLKPLGAIEGLSLGPIRLSGTKLIMESPRLTGFRRDNRGYEVTATTATQDVRKPTVFELRDMRARFAMDERGGSARLAADFGVFDSQKETLELRQNVRVTTDSGQEALLASASADMKGGVVRSPEPVSLRFVGGSVNAEALEVLDQGKVVSFIGRVRTVIERGEPGKEGRNEVAAAVPMEEEDVFQSRPTAPVPASLRR